MQVLLARRFSTSGALLSLRTKTKIKAAISRENILVDKKQYDAKTLKKQKDFNNTPVKDASAHKILSDLLGREISAEEPIGPHTLFTAKELNMIFRQNNLRLVYKVLGTSGRQIQDSLLVDSDVQKLLARNDLLRAKQLARMARYQGHFAYGTIVQYLLERGQVNDAFDVFLDLKKRGFKPKGRFYNILISGYADAVSKLKGNAEVSQQKIEQLYRAFQKDHAENNAELSIYHVNSLLKVFRKGKRLDLAMHLYDSLKNVRSGKLRLKPDVRTYTEMLRILSSAQPTDLISFNEIINRAETIFYNAQHNIHIKVDAYLVRAYASLFVYCDDLKMRARAVTIIREWFRISTLEDIKIKIDEKNYDEKLWQKVLDQNGIRKIDDSNPPKLLSFEEINSGKKKRFEPDSAILRMYGELCAVFKLPFSYKEQTIVKNGVVKTPKM